MSLTRSQFTIGQLVYLTFICAIVFWTLRVTGPAYVVVFLPTVLGIPVDRAKEGHGLGGSIRFRCLAFVGFGIAYCAYFYFFPDPRAVEYGVLVFCLCSVFLLVSLWRAAVNKRNYSNSLIDESDGAIVWRGFDGD